MTQTEHLQAVILSIMKDIDKMCRENGIEYYLFGGSALGAKRHNGFIPWDDDLDIVLLPPMYDKFIEMCRDKLDKDKYILQEGQVDWPEHFSKIRLRGTHISEIGDYYTNSDNDGIYVDVFRVDYASNSCFGRRWQYVMGKLWLAYNMNLRHYQPEGFARKAMSLIAQTLKITPLRSFVVKEYLKYNKKGVPTNWVSDVLGRTRMHNAFVPMATYGTPTETAFEDTRFFVHEDVHNYLSITFGDYMKLPPVEKRVGLHIKNIDFGKY